MTTLLKSIPKEDLPRERLIANGARNLSNEELLAIILRTGTTGISVKTLSENILSNCKRIEDLKDLSLNKLKKIKGLGPTKSVTLLAALELGRRVYEENRVKTSVKVRNSRDAYKFFGKYIAYEKQENLMVVYLDNYKKYISHKIIFKGTLTESVVHPREIFKEAFLESAQAVIIMHNHPSGEVSPSTSDDETTVNLIEVGNLLGVQVLDHIIVGTSTYYSYLEEGRLKYE